MVSRVFLIFILLLALESKLPLPFSNRSCIFTSKFVACVGNAFAIGLLTTVKNIYGTVSKGQSRIYYIYMYVAYQ
jgi:hypothetical protein